jgi:xylulokinase
MTWLLGIDIGTTGVRAAIVDGAGRRVADAGIPCPPHTPREGHVEADAEAWWAAVLSVLARLVDSGVSLARVDAVGVTGQAPTAVLVDGEGRSQRPAVLWLDVRAADEARAIDEALGPGRAEAIGANRVHPYFLGPKLAWLAKHDPDALRAARHVLQSHAFVAMRLTGEAACDRSTAMLCAPLFDVHAGGWSTEGSAAVGVDLPLLPRVVRAHDVLGAVTRDAAAATGLRAGTPVVAGGGDFAASALAAGVVEEGRACAMLGTAGNLLLPRRSPGLDSRLIQSHHVGVDRWLSLCGTLCGAALEWFRRECAQGCAWQDLEREAVAVPAGADGVVCLPYFQGERTPIWNERARAVFFGLTLTHRRGHMYRALIEAIALGLRHGLAVAEEQDAVALEEVVAIDGAAESPLLRQTLCNALGVPLVWRKSVSEGGAGTVTGAAALAGLGIGIPLPPPADGVRHEPDPAAQAQLTRVFEKRLALYDAVRVGSCSKLG